MTEIIKKVEYRGKTLPLSERISLYDLLICIVSNTPPVDERCRNFVKEQRQSIYKMFRDEDVYYEASTNIEKHQYASEEIERAVNKAKEEVFYQLMMANFLARGKRITFSLSDEFGSDTVIFTEFMKEEEEDIAPEFWYDKKVFWPDKVLQLDSYKEVAKEIVEYDIEGYPIDSALVQVEREQECFFQITLATQDVIKIWPQLLEQQEMIDWEQEYNNLATEIKELHNTVRVKQAHIEQLESQLSGAINNQIINSYTSPYMKLMQEAVIENKITAENYPTKETLVQWFKDNEPEGINISPNIRGFMASAIRSPEAQRGGNKRTS